MEGIEDRQRVDRWLEESQYLIGRIIPSYLDDRERVKARLENVEQDNERLKIELADARREISELRGDLEFHRGERMRIAENFHTIVDHLTALQGPVNDVASRLQTLHSVAAA
jgi:chromosome segregation ATPase